MSETPSKESKAFDAWWNDQTGDREASLRDWCREAWFAQATRIAELERKLQQEVASNEILANRLAVLHNDHAYDIARQALKEPTT